MLFSMVEFADNFFQRRRSVIAAYAFIVAVVPIPFIAPILQAHHSSIAAQIQASYADQQPSSTNDNPNVVTNALFQMADDAGQSTNVMEAKTLSSIMWAAAGITGVEKGIAHGAFASISSTTHLIGDSFAFSGHVVDDTFGFFTGLT